MTVIGHREAGARAGTGAIACSACAAMVASAASAGLAGAGGSFGGAFGGGSEGGAAKGGMPLRLTELRVDQQGTDSDEYFEISGTPGASLAGCWFVAIGDGASDPAGVVEMAINLGTWSLGANGCLVAHEATFGTVAFDGRTLQVHPDATNVTIGTGDSLNFENSDSITYLLVSGFAGTVGADLDTDNDGVLDLTPWTSVIDSVAFIRAGSKDPVYSEARLGPVDLTATGGMPPHGWRDAKGWHAGGYASWSEDTPGTSSAIPAPGAAVTLLAALAVGRARVRGGLPARVRTRGRHRA